MGKQALQEHGIANFAMLVPKKKKGECKSEADSGSTQVAQLRHGVKPKKESAVQIGSRTRLREAGAAASAGTRFRVTLIQEGMGNLNDCFYYTKDCLKNAVSVFEGVKCYADHQDQIQEQVQPERSTRDILGHFENVEYVEDKKRGTLEADFLLCEGVHFEWAKSLLTNALEYAKKYPSADFVGFSINAQGEAGSVGIEDFIRNSDVPESAIGKLQQAISEGIEEIRPVSVLRDAVSCDLVTEAGAGGKILTMMERNKKPMSKKIVQETNRKNSRQVREGEAGGEDHADADADKALFAKMIKQYMGDDHGVDENEAMEAAKTAHEHFMKQGMEAHEAYEAAGNHIKAAHEMGAMKCKQAESEAEAEKKESERKEAEAESEKKEAERKEAEAQEAAGGETPPPNPKVKGKGTADAEPKESAAMRKELIETKAEVARLRESIGRVETLGYLDKKLMASDKSPEFIKAFREALGKPKSVAHVEETWAIFTKAHEAALQQSGDETDSGIFTEKSAGFREASGGGKVYDFTGGVEAE